MDDTNRKGWRKTQQEELSLCRNTTVRRECVIYVRGEGKFLDTAQTRFSHYVFNFNSYVIFTEHNTVSIFHVLNIFWKATFLTVIVCPFDFTYWAIIVSLCQWD